MRRLIVWFSSLNFLLFSQLVYAVDKSPLNLTPPTSDYSVKFLEYIFGVVDGVLSGEGSYMIGKLSMVLNTVTIFLAAVFIIYTLFVSTLKTADDGEQMNQRWSSPWIPIRAAAGIALMLPKASGYGLMQIFIMWIVLQGIGAADLVWGKALDYLQQGGSIVQPNLKPVKENDDKLQQAAKMLRVTVCLHALQAGLDGQRRYDFENQIYKPGTKYDHGPVPVMTTIPDFLGTQESQSDPKVELPNVGNVMFYSQFNGQCGSISWEKFSQDQIDELSNKTGISKNDPLLSDLTNRRAIAVQQMYFDMDRLGARIVANYQADSPQSLGTLVDGVWKPNDALLQGNELKDAVNSYYAIMKPALTSLKNKVKDDTKFIEEARKKGWIMAGSYYYDLLNTRRDATNVLRLYGTLSVRAGPAQSIANNPALRHLEEINCIAPTYNRMITQFADYESVAGKALTNYINGALLFPQQKQIGAGPKGYHWVDYTWDFKRVSLPGPKQCKSGGGPFGKIKKYLCKYVYYYPKHYVMEYVIQYSLGPLISDINKIFQPFSALVSIFYSAIIAALEDGSDPVVAMMDLGDIYIQTVYSVWIAVIILNGIVGAIPGLNMIGQAVFVFIAPFLFTVLGSLFASGVLMVYYIPLLPYILFLAGGLAWFISVVEVMVAGPIMAFGIAFPEGGNFVGRSRSGFMLLLNVFFRPTFMIIGFFASMIIINVGIWLVNVGFDKIAFAIMTDHSNLFAQILAPIFMIVVHCLLYKEVTQVAFSLIHRIPDNILSMISGGESMGYGGEVAQELARATRRQVQETGAGLAKISGEVGQQAFGPVANLTRKIYHFVKQVVKFVVKLVIGIVVLLILTVIPIIPPPP